MAKSITILLDEDLVKKLGDIQSSRLSKSKTYVSFSRVVNDELRKTIKQTLKLSFVNTRCKYEVAFINELDKYQFTNIIPTWVEESQWYWMMKL